MTIFGFYFLLILTCLNILASIHNCSKDGEPRGEYNAVIEASSIVLYFFIILILLEVV